MIPWWRTTQMFRSLKSSVTLSSGKSSGKPTVTLLGGSESTLGNRKRTVPSIMPTIDAVNANQAIAIQLPNIANRKKRRSLPVLAGVLGGAVGFCGTGGFGGGAGGGGTAGGAPVTLVVSDMIIVQLPTAEESQIGSDARGTF